MVARYVKAQLMVLLCGGIVGPIFLAVYFLSGFGDLVAWMLWVGLLITALDVVIAIALAFFGAQKAARTQHLETSGVLALAQILGIQETGTRINDNPLVKLNLRIEGPGIATFDAQDSVIASVSRVGLISARKLVALVDPVTSQFQIDWNRSALVAGAVPAQFTVAEDNRTYDLTGQVGPLMEIMHILKANGVPIDGSIDIRSNPAVRQQVMSVVRRAAAQGQPAAAPYGAPPPPGYAAPPPPGFMAAPEPSVSQRLQELETLRATGAISESEYASKRQQIISEL
jgi:hypothetical protein